MYYLSEATKKLKKVTEDTLEKVETKRRYDLLRKL